MRKLLLALFVFMISSQVAANQELKGSLLLTSQLNEWCMSQDGIKQQFCQAYILGVYETTDCKFKIKTPEFTELRTVFVTWVFAMGDDSYLYAVESVQAAIKKKYGCR